MNISPIPTLKTSRLLLRKVCEGDWQQILHLRSDPQINALVKRPLSTKKEDATAFIAKADQDNKAGKIAYWGIVRPETDEVMGSICLWNFSEDRKTAEIGYDLSVAEQGNGYMTEAVQAVLDFGFSRLNFENVEAYTQSNNAASVRLLRKFSFRLLEGRKDENNSLNAVYSLSNLDYRSVIGSNQ